MAYSKNRRLADIIADTDGNLSAIGITVPTQSASDNDTSAASTAYVTTAVNNLIDSAPGTMNTLNEIAAAINDDADFNTTVNTAINLKAPLASPDFTGDVTFDTSTLVVDSTNNRVGINRASPSHALHVIGGDNDEARVRVHNSASGQAGFDLDNSEGYFRTFTDAGEYRIYDQTDGAYRLVIDTSGKLIINDSASHVDDLLQIETPASGGGHGIQIRRNDSNNDQGIGRIMFGNNTDTDLATIQATTDGSTDNARLTFHTQPNGGSSTERMRIASSGKVGIGNASPDSLLHLSGNSDDGDGLCMIIINDEDSDTGSQIPAIQFRGADSNIARIRANTSQGLLLSGSSAHDDDIVVQHGKVGIGTNSPNISKGLHINSAGNTQLRLTTTQDSNTPTAQIGYGAGSGYFFRLADAANNEDIMLRTYGNSIFNGGNVGIGTSSPSSLLHIEGNTNEYSTSPILYFGSTSTANAAVRDWAIGPADNAYGNFHIYRGTSTGSNPIGLNGIVFTITSSGHVGINNASPGGGSSSLKTLNINGAIMTLSSSNGSGRHYIYEQRYAGSNNLTMGYVANGSTHTAGFVSSQNNLPLRVGVGNNDNIVLNSSSGTAVVVYGHNSTGGTVNWIADSNKGSNESHLHYGSNGDWYIRPANNSGTVYVKNYQAESDSRLKENIENIEYGTTEILQLRPRKFNWIGESIEQNGFIAQEVESTIPAFVRTGEMKINDDDEEGIKSVDYNSIVAALVKTVQELEARIKTLEG